MKHHLFAALTAAAAGCVPTMQVAQNPAQKGPFTVRVGSGVDARCMIASTTEKPIFVRSLVLKAWTTPTNACPDMDGDGFCETTKEVGKEFFLSPGREQYFGDCVLMPEAKGWDFEVFYEEADVGAETVAFSKDAASARPPTASIAPRSASRPNEHAVLPPSLPAPAPDSAAKPLTPPVPSQSP